MIINMPFRKHRPDKIATSILDSSEVERFVGPIYAAWAEHEATNADVLEALRIDLQNAVMRGDATRASAVRASIATITAKRG